MEHLVFPIALSPLFFISPINIVSIILSVSIIVIPPVGVHASGVVVVVTAPAAEPGPVAACAGVAAGDVASAGIALEVVLRWRVQGCILSLVLR